MIWRTALPAMAGMALFAATSYQTEIAQWRQQREANLKRDGGWLSVAGLFWLHEGANTFGKDPGNEIAEQFRAMRTNLLFRLTDAPEKVIVTSSSMENEGKTFVAA